jgi:hypothetical protein
LKEENKPMSKNDAKYFLSCKKKNRMKHLLLNNKIILIKALISLKMLKMTTW